MPMSQTPQDSSAKVARGCLGAAVLVPVLFVGGCFVLLNSAKDNPPGESQMQAAATVACRDATKEQLKSPRSAKFSDESVSGSAGSYRVVGSVDAQNTYGALVRARFTCTARVSTASGDAVSASATVLG